MCLIKSHNCGCNWPAEGATVGFPAIRWTLLLLISAVVFGGQAQAQEALQNSIAGVANADSRAKQMQSPDYTFKYGDFQTLLTATAQAQWNDNVNLSKTNKLDDYILTPSLRITSSYPLTQKNVLFLDISIGYSEYLLHPSLSTFVLNSSSGTGLSFDIGIKDVTINLHDWIRYMQDGAQNATVANTSDYGTFDNTIGLAATWELNQITLSAGYDHENVIATQSEFDSTTHSSDLFFARAGFKVHPQMTLGLESSATLTTYDKNLLNDNNAYTAGAYMQFNPGTAMQLTARGGYTTYRFQQTSTTIQAGSPNSYYISLDLSHQPLDWLEYSVQAGHEVRLGTMSDLTEDWYFRPNITWKFIRGVNFNTGFFYEHGKQGYGDTSGVLTENYDWYGGMFSVDHEITRRFSAGVNYRLTLRSSDIPNNGYAQNMLGVYLTYHPK